MRETSLEEESGYQGVGKASTQKRICDKVFPSLHPPPLFKISNKVQTLHQFSQCMCKILSEDEVLILCP